MNEYLTMIVSHIIKVVEYYATQVIPNLEVAQLPMLIDEYAHYIFKVIHIYITIFLRAG